MPDLPGRTGVNINNRHGERVASVSAYDDNIHRPMPGCNITTPHEHSSHDDPIDCPLRDGDPCRRCGRPADGPGTERCLHKSEFTTDAATDSATWVLAPCPECGEAVTSATHNRDLDLPALIERHQGWTVAPCGHHPATYLPVSGWRQ